MKGEYMTVNEPEIDPLQLRTLSAWLASTAFGASDLKPVCFLGHADSQRRFYDWAESAGKVSRKDDALTLGRDGRILSKKFAENVRAPDWAAGAMLELRVPREGISVLDRQFDITCVVGGPLAYVNYALEDAGRLLLLMEKDAIWRIKDARGRSLKQVPLDDAGRLDITEGAVRVTCRQDIDWMKSHARSLLPPGDGQ